MSLSILALAPQHPATRAMPAKTKAEKAAADFEAVLLASLLEKLQKTFAGTPDNDPSGSNNYATLGTQALASAMAERGGIGIARMILEQWKRTEVPEIRRTEVPSRV